MLLSLFILLSHFHLGASQFPWSIRPLACKCCVTMAIKACKAWLWLSTLILFFESVINFLCDTTSTRRQETKYCPPDSQ